MTAKTTKLKTVGEQIDLFDFHPENAKKVVVKAKEYKAIQAVRIKALKGEIKLKQEMIELVKEAKLQPDKNGAYKFTCGDLSISITPRDELVTVSDKKAPKTPKKK